MRPYQELIRQAGGGSRTAFSELVRRFSDMARTVALRRLHDPDLAEDALQDAFLTAWLHLAGLRNPDAFPAWLRGVVINSCRRAARSRTCGPLTSELDDLENLPSDEFDPLEHYARAQSRDMVLALIATLSGTYREAAVQRYLLGLSYEDISTSLGVPLGTIKRRLHETRTLMIRGLGESATPTIRVGYIPISDHLLPMIAHQRHDQSTFRVCLRKFLSWSELTRAMANESLDAAMMMAPLAMVLHNRGMALKWAMDGHHDGSSIAVHASIARNLLRHEVRTWPRNLAGATLALPHALSTHGMLLRSVLGFGSSGGPGPFKAVYMNPSFMNRPLAQHRLDGFFCAEPWGLMAESSGSGTVLIRSRDLAPDHVCCILAVRADFARGHPETLDSYLNLLHAAADYTHSHPQESAAIQSSYTGVQQNAAAHILDRGFVTFRDLAPDRARAEGVMNMAISAGILDRPCDLNSLLLTRAN